MRKANLVAATSGVVLAICSAALASNMSFSLKMNLLAAQSGVSATGTNVIALPYRPGSLQSANDLLQSIGLANVTNVQRFLTATDGLEVYTGRKGSPGSNFALTPGQAYWVKIASNVTYRAVGSEHPGLAINLSAAGSGSLTGTHFLALPYNHTAGTAKQLMDDIGFSSVSNIQRFLRATDGLEVYTGRKGSAGSDFTLVPGEGYFVKMNSTVNYVPSHY